LVSTMVLMLLFGVARMRRPRILLMLFMLFILGISHAEDRSSTPDVVGPEEYKVYEDLMDHPQGKTGLSILDLRHGAVVIEEMTSTRKKWPDSSSAALKGHLREGSLIQVS
jgi:hypothetical protein